MKHLGVADVLANANAAMVDPDFDVTGALASLVVGATSAVSTQAAAVLVDVDRNLEVLAASSHRVLDLEIHQKQAQEGPCLDAIRSGVDVHELGADAIRSRWPRVGPIIVDSGYSSVQALPLTWHGATFGGLNLFRAEPTGFERQQADCRALADAVTLLIVTADAQDDLVVAGLRSAIEERAVVELAKGALAHAWGLEMAAAYDALADVAQERHLTLGVAARQVMAQARRNELPPRPATP